MPKVSSFSYKPATRIEVIVLWDVLKQTSKCIWGW